MQGIHTGLLGWSLEIKENKDVVDWLEEQAMISLQGMAEFLANI